ncbi:hypothetical protein ZIOFF_039796 [Zingiber officinale]|uniref:Deoxyuridine 5'-triphosphate nucleotidohydrolase n=1 Tax=Zingiber officinale TaxID=94328 RepID=A0A8J5GGI7_ZINOF|nr:hypothetical protein ZIOFF_039796 [Zingiber officinale]
MRRLQLGVLAGAVVGRGYESGEPGRCCGSLAEPRSGPVRLAVANQEEVGRGAREPSESGAHVLNASGARELNEREAHEIEGSKACEIEGHRTFKRISSLAKLPERQTSGAAGYDISITHAQDIPAGGRSLLTTGICIQIPQNTYARIAPRSSAALQGIIIMGGVIDSDYRGEVKIMAFNTTNDDIFLRKQECIAQLILERISTPSVREVEVLGSTSRGMLGFGSTTKQVHEREDSGEIDILTKGDNNFGDDRLLYAHGQLWLQQHHIMGRAVGFLPYVGWVTIIMTEKPIIKVIFQMAPQSDLCKVGKEGFDMIDEYLSRKRRQGRFNEKKHNTPAKKEPMLDSIQAAKQFNGVLFMRYYPAANMYRRFN